MFGAGRQGQQPPPRPNPHGIPRAVYNAMNADDQDALDDWVQDLQRNQQPAPRQHFTINNSSVEKPLYKPKEQTAEAYLDEVEAYFLSQNYPDEHYSRLFRTLINTEVKAWFDNEKDKWVDWDDLKAAFIAKYDTWYEKQERERILYTRTMRQNETVSEFVWEMVRLSRMVYPHEDESVTVQRCRQGLLPNIRVALGKPKDWEIDSLIQDCEVVMADLRDLNRFENNPKYKPTGNGNGNGDSSNVNYQGNSNGYRGQNGSYRGRGHYHNSYQNHNRPYPNYQNQDQGSNHDANSNQSLHEQHVNRRNGNGNRGSRGHAFRGNGNSRRNRNGNGNGNGHSRGNYSNRRGNGNSRRYSNPTASYRDGYEYSNDEVSYRDGYEYSNDEVSYREGYENGVEQNGNSANEYIPSRCYRCHGEGHMAYQCPTGRSMAFMAMAPTNNQHEEEYHEFNHQGQPDQDYGGNSYNQQQIPDSPNGYQNQRQQHHASNYIPNSWRY